MTRQQIYNLLKRGDQSKIAETVGMKVQTVHSVLRKNHQAKGKNTKRILEEAETIARENLKELKKIK